MRKTDIIPQKIYTLPELLKQINRWRLMHKSIAFTNGCFDILHQGHIFSLSEAAAEADYLIVGVNADASVRKLKGENRPLNHERSRAMLLASLLMTDAVIVFEEDTPLSLISAVLPDVLVKGGDYAIDEVVGAKEVIANGGKVVINPILPGFSTTGLIERSKAT
jgi:D-beta-D-heptose 7-phosphate kinase/D-beta-D-heptose 1-phosphate adenosyltransferase